MMKWIFAESTKNSISKYFFTIFVTTALFGILEKKINIKLTLNQFICLNSINAYRLMSNRQSSFPLNTYIVLITFESKFSQVKSARNTTVEWLLASIKRSIYLRKVKRDDRSIFEIILSYGETQNIDVNRSYITSKWNIGTGRNLSTHKSVWCVHFDGSCHWWS